MTSVDDRRVILALDQGTTSSRAIAFAPDGAVRGVSQKELGLSFPEPGWVEMDPEEIWAAQQELDFPGYVFGLDRETPDLMVQLTERYGRSLARHRSDRMLG